MFIRARHLILMSTESDLGTNGGLKRRPMEYVLSAILVMRVQKKKYEEWILSKELDKNQKRILNLAGFDERIYCKLVRTN